jgi:hypothetical protein
LVIRHPIDTVYFPLSYSDNPGVYGVSYRGQRMLTRNFAGRSAVKATALGPYQQHMSRYQVTMNALRRKHAVTPGLLWQPRGKPPILTGGSPARM